MRFASLLALLASAALVSAHGFLYSPTPRGIQKEHHALDQLNAPNKRGLCRGEPVGAIHKVKPGQPLTLRFKTAAAHVGPCEIMLVDTHLKKVVRHISKRNNCMAPGKGGPWQIKLPKDLSGRMVLRWYWQARHKKPYEEYEQCVDLDFGAALRKPLTHPKKPVHPKRPAPPKRPAHPKKPAHPKGPAHPKKPTSPKKPVDPKQPVDPKDPVDPKGPVDPKDPVDPKKPTDSKVPTSPASRTCKDGRFVCLDVASYASCEHGKWAPKECGDGFACTAASPDTITCSPIRSGSDN